MSTSSHLFVFALCRISVVLVRLMRTFSLCSSHCMYSDLTAFRSPETQFAVPKRSIHRGPAFFLAIHWDGMGLPSIEESQNQIKWESQAAGFPGWLSAIALTGPNDPSFLWPKMATHVQVIIGKTFLYQKNILWIKSITKMSQFYGNKKRWHHSGQVFQILVFQIQVFPPLNEVESFGIAKKTLQNIPVKIFQKKNAKSRGYLEQTIKYHPANLSPSKLHIKTHLVFCMFLKSLRCILRMIRRPQLKEKQGSGHR